MDILLLANTSHHTSAVLDHIKAVTAGSAFCWHIENPITCKTLHHLELDRFDAIGIHYSIRPEWRYHLPDSLAKAIAQFHGIKFVFLQDEHRHVNETVSALSALGIDLLFTLVSQSKYQLAYPQKEMRDITKVSLLTAYVPDTLTQIDTPPMCDRPLHIFYRTRPYEYWLGELAQERVLIAEGMASHAAENKLQVDISTREEDRLYGTAWQSIHQRAKTVLATESGASIWDYHGNAQHEVETALQQQPNLSFDEISKQILYKYENIMRYSAISPRHLEAIAYKTVLVMFPGEYNGILKPGRHFIELKKDFSNVDSVIQKIKDDDYLEALATQAHQDIIQSGLYAEKVLTQTVESALQAALQHHTTTTREDKETDISQHITETKKTYSLQNRWLVLSTEIGFGVKQVFQILVTSKAPIRTKWAYLTSGMKRYCCYVLARLKKQA